MKQKELSLPCRCSQELEKDNTTEQGLVPRLKRGLELKLEMELVRGELLDSKGCNNAGQAGTDRANNGDLGT